MTDSTTLISFGLAAAVLMIRQKYVIGTAYLALGMVAATVPSDQK